MNIENPGIQIFAPVLGNDFDNVDKDIINQQIEEANKGDNDEEEAIKYGY